MLGGYMDKHKNIIDVDFIDTGTSESNYYTIDDISKLLDEEIKIINYWCVKLDDILNINTIGRDKIFSETDLNNLKQVKHLIREKKMDTDQVKKYLNRPETKVIKRDNNQIPMNMINTIANVIAMQVSNSIAESNKEICITVSKQNEYIEQLEKKIDFLSKQNEDILDKIDAQEQNFIDRDTVLIDKLRASMEDHRLKLEYQRQLQQKKSFWSKLIGK
jgi:hypothetical protein